MDDFPRLRTRAASVGVLINNAGPGADEEIGEGVEFKTLKVERYVYNKFQPVFQKNK